MKNFLRNCSKKRRAALYCFLGAAGLWFINFYSIARQNSSLEVQMRTRIIPILSDAELATNSTVCVVLLAAGVLLFVFTHRWRGRACRDCGRKREKRRDRIV